MALRPRGERRPERMHGTRRGLNLFIGLARRGFGSPQQRFGSRRQRPCILMRSLMRGWMLRWIRGVRLGRLHVILGRVPGLQRGVILGMYAGRFYGQSGGFLVRFLVRNSRGGARKLVLLAGNFSPYRQCKIVIERAGVCFLIADAQFGQYVEDHVGLDLELTGQLVDADLTHTFEAQLPQWRPGLRNTPSLYKNAGHNSIHSSIRERSTALDLTRKQGHFSRAPAPC